MKRLFLIGLLSLTLAPLPAWAADNDAAKGRGLYASFGASYVNLQDSTFSDGVDSVEVESDGGYGLLAALGYKFDNNMRAEGEIAYRRNDLDNVEGVALDGNAKSWSFMANTYYDFAGDGKVQPYLGAGIGVAHVSQDSSFTVGVAFTSEGSDTVLAYQAIAGVAVPVADKTNLGFEYRYFATDNPEDGGIEAEYRSHNIGLRLSHYF